MTDLQLWEAEVNGNAPLATEPSRKRPGRLARFVRAALESLAYTDPMSVYVTPAFRPEEVREPNPAALAHIMRRDGSEEVTE